MYNEYLQLDSQRVDDFVGAAEVVNVVSGRVEENRIEIRHTSHSAGIEVERSWNTREDPFCLTTTDSNLKMFARL